MHNILFLAYVKGSASVKQLMVDAVNNDIHVKGISKEEWDSCSSAQQTSYLTNYNLVVNWGCRLKAPYKAIVNANSFMVQGKDDFFYYCLPYESVKDYIPRFTLDSDEARLWIEQGHSVVARQFLNKSGGVGLTIHSSLPLPKVPLYTQYYKKHSEYRVHFFKIGSVVKLFTQKKKKLKEALVGEEKLQNVYKIRNLDHGWVYSSVNFEPPPNLLPVAEKVARILPLTFGALDIIYNKLYDTYRVLEVNTAPGLCSVTSKFYMENFKTYEMHSM